MRTFGKARILFAGASALAGLLARAEAPSWTFQSYYEGVPSSAVLCVDRSGDVDLVVLKPARGSLRIGAVCALVRGNETVGSVVIADSRDGMNVALPVGETRARSGDAAIPQITRHY